MITSVAGTTGFLWPYGLIFIEGMHSVVHEDDKKFGSCRIHGVGGCVYIPGILLGIY